MSERAHVCQPLTYKHLKFMQGQHYVCDHMSAVVLRAKDRSQVASTLTVISAVKCFALEGWRLEARGIERSLSRSDLPGDFGPSEA